jgi:hypothetical protein
VGRRLWSPGPRLRTTLLWTHGILLVFGSLAVYVGIHSVEAAEISISRGGGLLSPLAWIPLLFGLPTVVLAAFSLLAAMLALPADRAGGRRQEAALDGTRVAIGRPVMRLLLAWILLACGFTVLLPSLWPMSEAQKAAKQMEMTFARKKANIDALRALSRRPPEETQAVLRSAIMDGRLDVMRLTDQDATLVLVTANLPVVFECIDILEAKHARVMEQIKKQGAIRSWADMEMEDEHLRLTNSTSDLGSVLRNVKHVPAGLESFLVQRSARKGPGRSAAISLIGKLDIPKEKRIGLLMSFVTDDDEQAATAVRQALAQLGIQVGPALKELKHLRAERGKDPLTEAASLPDDRPTNRLPDQHRNQGSRGTGGGQAAYMASTGAERALNMIIPDNWKIVELSESPPSGSYTPGHLAPSSSGDLLASAGFG